ncbi:MAG TPA: aldose epimerase family protein [Burkholderiaceae bacterium]
MEDITELPPGRGGVTQKAFGFLPDGRPARLYTLANERGMIVRVTDFGGIITELHVPDRDGMLGDVVLGFDSVEPYCGESAYFGALIGRYANRIAGARYTAEGVSHELDRNDGANHLHGGALGFHKVLWQAEPFESGAAAGLRLRYLSPDGEQGYPGNLQATVTYTLTQGNELIVQYQAVTDRATPVNLTQHSYFNLACGGAILNHELSMQAAYYTPVDAGLIPLPEHAAVAGTPFDFRSPHAIGARIAQDDVQLARGRGYDHNFVLDKGTPKGLGLAAAVYDPRSGRVLEILTQEPGLQFYSGNFLDGTLQGKGRSYGWRSGFCLEPQHFPDSPNRPDYPNTVLQPGAEYNSRTIYRFSVRS